MPPRNQVSREESWQSLHHSEASADNEEDGYTDISMEDAADDEDDHSSVEMPMFPTVNDVRRALHPLQATADRLGKQVENFATTLDRLTSKRQKTAHPDCRYTLPQIKEYQKIANDTTIQLKKSLAPERRRQVAKQAKRKNQKLRTGSNPDVVDTGNNLDLDAKVESDDLRRWEAEEQTWGLLGLMLQNEFPVPENERQTLKKHFKDAPSMVRPVRSKDVHKYSSEKQVWDNFLATDDEAWERHTVTEWLKKCADKSRPDIDEVVEDLEAEADRGSGLVAHSWLYTREAIKGQKRLRSWPKALEPDGPGLKTSLVNSSRTEALVTQLDPDAISRQDRHLEKQDQCFEQAIWLACWEMVRRGKDWDFVHNWCLERNELWRSTSMRSDPHFLTSSSADWHARYLWRKTCALAAKDGVHDYHQNAFYGALSGYFPSVQKASRSWDDYLFAYYNSLLMSAFERYTELEFKDRYPSVVGTRKCTLDFTISADIQKLSGNDVVERLKTVPETMQEALGALKMLQGSIIAKTFQSFVFKHGVQLTQAANAESASKILPAMDISYLGKTYTAPLTMKDHELLRMLTHIIFIFQDMGYEFAHGSTLFAVESIIVAYIDFLGKAGKQQILPLYASRLSPERCITCLARQLPLVLETGERQTMMKLMKKYHIDVGAVLAMQLQLIIEETEIPLNTDFIGDFPALKILEAQSDDQFTPRQIRPRFIGEDISDEQYDLIHGMEWFMLMEGQWRDSMLIGATIYKYFLRTGALAAARLLSRQVTFSKFSLCKTQGILGYVTDIGKDDESADEESVPRTPPKTRSKLAQKQRPQASVPAERIKNERAVLLHQSKSFRDLENLFVALDAMERWKELSIEAERYTNRRQDSKPWNERKGPFLKAYNDVDTAVSRLLHGWLEDPKNDEEATEFKQLRLACLPEIVLAFNSILTKSARYVSRDSLIKSMDLVTIVAAGNSDLTLCFIEADRMPELVQSFAWSSKNMILACDAGGRNKKKKDGETLDLWTVKRPKAVQAD